MTGTLYVVATPIGNLEDITLRALRILRDEVSTIACEDTRQTQKLLAHYTIRKPLLSYHEHNEASRTEQLLEMLHAGESVALVSDAGTPLLSDPGYRIVAAAARQDIRIVPVPGASAALAALVASGLPTDSFLFLGFLPPKPTARRNKLAGLVSASATLVFYESPHRILDTLAAVAEILGERQIVLGRELTKLHEEFLRGTVSQIREQLAARASIKGEITIVISKAVEIGQELDVSAAVASLERAGMPRMDAIKAIAKQLALAKREVYRAVEEAGNNREDRGRDADQIDQSQLED